MSKLKPCPECGQDECMSDVEGTILEKRAFIECHGRDKDGNFCKYFRVRSVNKNDPYKVEEELRRAHNTRPIEDALHKEIAELKERLVRYEGKISSDQL